MSDLPTPETDALFGHYLKYEPWTNKPIFDLARKIERERNEAREQRDRLAEALRDILNDGQDHPLYKIKSANSALAYVDGGDK